MKNSKELLFDDTVSLKVPHVEPMTPANKEQQLERVATVTQNMRKELADTIKNGDHTWSTMHVLNYITRFEAILRSKQDEN